jgi:hypothetical protein
MYRMTGQSAPSHIPATASRATGSRSPFVRMRELIDRFPPGQPAISLAVGEPQHPIPPFVGPVIAAHVNEFGRYPANKGLDEFGVAVASRVAAAIAGRRITPFGELWRRRRRAARSSRRPGVARLWFGRQLPCSAMTFFSL